MTSRMPLGAILSELALRAVGALVPPVRDDIRAMFNSRQEYRRTPPARETRAARNNGFDVRRAVTPMFFAFLMIFARFYLQLMRHMLPLNGLDFAVAMPAIGQDHGLQPSFDMLAHFLVVFARNHLSYVRRKALLITPPVMPGLRSALHAFTHPVIALDVTHFTLRSPSACLTREFFDVPASVAELRVLRELAKLFVKLQNLLGAGCLMSTADQAKTVSALLASTMATLRTYGVPASKVNVLLEPVMRVVKLLRPRTATGKMSQAHRAYLLDVLLQRADIMQEAMEQALWTRNWPAIPAEIKSTDRLLSTKAATSSAKSTTASSAHCVPRRKPSAFVDPRTTHLRGSGAIVA
eukprot:jgi/Undpi1/2971/HiC_scaffold_14.g06348.m1